MKWLAFSLQPVLLEEFAEVFALEPDRSSPLDTKERFRNATNVLTCLRGLVILTPVDVDSQARYVWEDEYLGIIQFAHFSIQEYLASQRIRHGKAAFSFISHDDAHFFLANSCLSYHIQISETELATSKSISEYPLWTYAVQFWTKHLDEIKEISRTLPLTEKAIQIFRPGSQSFLNMIQMGDPHQGWKGGNRRNLEKTMDMLESPLYYAATLDMYQMTTFLIDCGANLNQCRKDKTFGTPLSAAVKQGHQRIVQILLERGADVNA